MNRLISYIHHTCEYKKYCHVGNTAKQCRLGLFQDSDFAGDLEDSKSTSGGTLCVFGSHTFVPISWMCKKQTTVSHSSTESEIISLDTEKVLREADGSVKLVAVRPHTDGKVFAPGCASKPDSESREEPEEHKRSIHGAVANICDEFEAHQDRSGEPDGQEDGVSKACQEQAAADS